MFNFEKSEFCTSVNNIYAIWKPGFSKLRLLSVGSSTAIQNLKYNCPSTMQVHVIKFIPSPLNSLLQPWIRTCYSDLVLKFALLNSSPCTTEHVINGHSLRKFQIRRGRNCRVVIKFSSIFHFWITFFGGEELVSCTTSFSYLSTYSVITIRNN